MAREYKINPDRRKGARHGACFPALPLWPILILAMMISLFSIASVFAKGGDQITRPATVVDTRAGKQIPKAMAVYSSSSGRGSVAVAGSTNSGGSDDYHVVKFNPYSSGIRWKPITQYTPYGGAGNDVTTAVAVDSAGNIIVTGYTTGANSDIHTIKYCGATGSPSCDGKAEGEAIWEHDYDVNIGSDYATAIAVDASDNIYVAGFGANGSRNDDFVIIKYAPGGPSPGPAWVELWDNDDNIYPNNHNRITAITAGSDGIAVTGYSSKGGADFDIMTRKYGFDKTLVRKWRYSSTGAGDDRGVAVKMDSSGNVIMTGYFTNAMNKTNIYTAKYAPNSDTPAWEKKDYVGVANDMPTGLWVDSGGDVYVTGSTYTLAGNNDFYTARFSSAGATVWEAIFDTGSAGNDIPAGIVVDNAADGGVFVTGSSSNAINNDFLTLKYKKDSAVKGVLLWKSIWNGPNNKNDQPIGIALEPRNVIVAGYTEVATGTDYDLAVIKYDYGPLNSPTNLKAETASDTSITLTWDDNSTNEEKFVIQRKLGESGTWADITTIDPLTHTHVPSPVHDPIILGPGTSTYTDVDLDTNNYYYYRVRAYNATNGDSGYSNEDRALTRAVSYTAPTWNFPYDGGFGLDDIATGITIDTTGTAATAGSPVVTGSSELQDISVPSVYSDDFLTFKLDRSDVATTTMKWKARYDSDSGNGAADNAAGVAMDSSGNVLVTGTSYTVLTSDDIYTRKVATAGLTNPALTPDLIWDDPYTGSGLEKIDTATTIAMTRDGSNNSVVIGYGKDAANNDRIYIIKYNADGTKPAWSPVVYNNGSTTRSFRVTGVAFDTTIPSNIYVTGYSFTTASPVGSYDWFTAKFNGSTGDLVWADNYNISNDVYGVSGDDKALSIDVDATGNAYVTGTAKNSGNTVIYTVKYKGTPAGAPTAERMWSGGAGVAFNNPGYDARPVAVRVDPIDGGVVVGGTAYNSTDSDFHLIRYNPADGTADGAVLADGTRPFWHEDFNVPVNYDYATAMTMDASGYIYLTGNSRLWPDTDSSKDFTSDILSVIYDYEGTFLGAMRYPLTHDDRQDEAKAIAANHRGEAFIAGFSKNAAGNKDYTVLKQVNGGLLVPGLFTATPQADYNKMDLAWVGQSSSDNYHVYRRLGSSNDPNDWTLIKTTIDNSQSWTDDSATSPAGPLLPGTYYCYTVDSYNGSLNSRKTPVCATTRLDKPTWTATPLTVDSTSQITLSWNPVADSTGYKIERKTGSTWGTVAANTTTNPYPDSGLLSGTTYYYRVSANNISGSSLPGTEPFATTKPDAPALNAPTDISNRQMKLTWGSVTGATSYLLQYRDTTTPGSWTDGCTASGCYVNLPTVDVFYEFRVKAATSGGDSAWSNTTTPVKAALAVPTWAADPNPTNITNNSMKYTWVNPTVTGANLTSYELQMEDTTTGSGWVASGCTMPSLTLYCTVTGLTAGDAYNFRVRSVNDTGVSGWSTLKPGTPVLGVPVWTATSNPSGVTYNQMTLGWGAVYGATGYTLEVTPQGSSAYTVACAGTTCNATGLASNTNHTFRVRTENGGASSAWTSTQPSGSKLTLLPTPSLSTATATSGETTKIDLVWTSSTGATGYSIEQSDCKNNDSDPSTCNGTTDANYNAWAPKTTVGAVTSTTITGLTGGTDYRYRITATVTGNSSVVSNVLHAWTNITPPTLTITPGGTTSLIPGWDQQPGETNYTVELSTTGIGGTYAAIPAATGLARNTPSYTHSGLSGTDDFCYKIKAYSTAPNAPAAAYSDPKCMKLPPAAPVISVSTSTLDSGYTVIEDVSKYWTTADYWMNQPVVITSGGNTYTRRIAGSVNTAFYVSPAFTAETINAGDSYVILHAVLLGTATGIDSGSPNDSLMDADKMWGGGREWQGSKVKILSSRTAGNIGVERTLRGNWGQSIYATSTFPSQIAAGDTYQIASFFGAATEVGTTTQLTHTGAGWTAGAWTDYYLYVTSGVNSGHARKITGNTTTILTTDPFPNAHGSGDTYLIAPVARVGTFFNKASAGSTSTMLFDQDNWWGATSYKDYYLVMTSGNNSGKMRKITTNTTITVTVSPAFEYAIASNDTYAIAPSAQVTSYFGTAAGSPGTSNTDLVDTTNTWLTDWTQGYFLMMTSGANNGQARPITGKTATTLTVSPAFTNNISATDTYLIGSTTALTGSGKVSTTVAPGLSYNGRSKLTLTSSDVEFKSVAPGYAHNYNYGLLSLKSLAPLMGDFDSRFDYTVMDGLVPADASLTYLYNASTYASVRYDFQSPTNVNYNTYIYRGRLLRQDTGRTTAFSAARDVLYDTRTMAGSTTPWKNWAVDQWKDFYVQITYGANNQLVRKVVSNTADSITLDSPLPNDTVARVGTAAAGGNSNTKLVDSVITNWTVNQWQNYYLHMSDGPNAGQTRKIISSDASSVTVEGAGFVSSIESNNSYRIFPMHGDVYRFNIISGNAAINGSTQSGINNTNSLLVDSSNNTGSTLPPKDWGTNQWTGFYLYISSGPNIGLFRTIQSNTANTITVNTPFPYQIASNDGYMIYDPRPEAQAIEAYWLQLYDQVTWITDFTIIPASDTSGKLRLAKTGNSLKFYTSPAAESWQLRKQLDLKASDAYTPIRYWIYQLGRLPHVAGTGQRTKISNFQYTVPAGNSTNISASYWAPEVGHVFRRLTLFGDQISWPKIDTATLYQVERCESNNHQNPATHTTVTDSTCVTFPQDQPTDGSTTVTNIASSIGLNPGYTYRFRVKARYNATDYTAWSNEVWITAQPPAPTMTAPVNAAATNPAVPATTTRLTPTWTNVNGDNGFKLYWKTSSDSTCSDGTWSATPIVQAKDAVTYNHNSLTPGTIYCYYITANGPSGPPVTPDSAPSNIVWQSTVPDPPTSITLGGITASKIDLSWSPAPTSGISGYKIERRTGAAGSWGTLVANASRTPQSYSDTTVAAGTEYYYRITSISNAGNSVVSGEYSTTTTPAAPSSLTPTVISSDEIDLSWPVALGATNYKIERKEGAGGSWAEIDNKAAAYQQSYCGEPYPTAACPTASATVITYADNTYSPRLKENTLYYYRVKSWNSTGGDSVPSAEMPATTLTMPRETLTATPLDGGFRIRLDWTATACTPDPCATPYKYELQRQVRDGIWVTLKTVFDSECTSPGGPCSYIDKLAINPGKLHKYRVRSLNEAGTDISPYSNEAAVFAKPYSAGPNVCTE